jgi:hypothetical protein
MGKVYLEEGFALKAILSLLEADKVLGKESLAVASGTKTQAEI